MTEQPNEYILVINCGSSSLKFSLYPTYSSLPEWSGSVSPVGTSKGRLIIKTAQNEILESHTATFKSLDSAVAAFIKWLKSNGRSYPLAAIGHRLVQGGAEHRQPEVITGELIQDLNEFIYLAPNHLPDELKAIKAFQSAFPDTTQVACFDTAFHKDMPSYAQHYPLPDIYRKKGLIKYGFHGLSYQYILQKLTKENPLVTQQKIIIAHLGNGASMAAVKNGISVETTMGVSPIGGLVMGTRSGDLDPGVLLFMLNQDKLTANQLEDLLSKNSGLKAIAGTGDIQELLKAEPGDPKAAEALTVFCYGAKKFIGALAAAMGGLDMLVFTGGIGENSAIIRERICEGLEFIGIDLDKAGNLKNEELISNRKSRATVHVIKTNEELMMAKLVEQVLNHKNKS